MNNGRREFLRSTAEGLAAAGLGTPVLGSILGSLAAGKNAPAAGAMDGLHHPAKAKRVIFLFMAGAPSQLDLFDYKPGLTDLFQEPLPPSVSNGQRVTAMTRGKEQRIAPSMFKFSQHGENGTYLSEVLPHLATKIDDICLIKSMHTDAINHDPGKTLICTGSEIPGKASLGAWLSYGLGRINENLPDFVVLSSAFWSGDQANIQALYSRLWGSGFLPTKHQGVAFQPSGDPVLFLSNPAGVDRTNRGKMLDLVTKLNQEHLHQVGDPEIMTTIAQQEMAFRMQMSVPELADVSDEPQSVLDLYGPEVGKSGSFARNCLLARRMVERDVRFVQLFHRGWDHHKGLPAKIRGQAMDVDQPIAGLLTDLKQNGLLDDTLVVFAGEFGRTTYCQGKLTTTDYGRDHHPRCFTAWMAGGGIKPGISYGQTDEFSYNIVENPVHVRDFNATILHQLGIDHNKLTFPFLGLDEKLTGVKETHVIHDILA
ncbi:DUF1501 domain-containing protein [Rubripirellula reticaptiva]|uniref:Sulfatase n=1 Tax=Rubripirellula reticaptiva TaxID=2528013 RepID=A0A5C6EI26_9BACT|nr:DUF1501 domain-containing protein [Rubripirellula reticaptiva]TWU48144.1 hypothetical protein Poly59_49900 [Rubripirellula reticaptiva]